MRAQGWVPTGELWLGDERIGRGYVRDDEHWNGWAIVALPRETVETLRAINDRWAAEQPDEIDILSWRGDTLVVIPPEGQDDAPEELAPIMVNGERCWTPGNYSWVWTVGR